ncbi:hypothetical protein, partial [Mesobacillus zeae]|uniref:hypothetical protein n=1 Tax=Mesobacillus zeae TaxID=1917180 RepID=UPI0030087A64
PGGIRVGKIIVYGQIFFKLLVTCRFFPSIHGRSLKSYFFYKEETCFIALSMDVEVLSGITIAF